MFIKSFARSSSIRTPVLILDKKRCFLNIMNKTNSFSQSVNGSDADNEKKKNENKDDKEQTQENHQDSMEKVDKYVAEISDLKTQLKDMKDHYLRSLAEAENLRERTRREKEMAQQLAIKGFATDLLSIADILDLALDSVPPEERNSSTNPHFKNLYVGLEMTSKEMKACFKRHGLESFNPLGEKFDPNSHQALFQAPVADKEPGTVFNVTKKGYKLHGIVIRAAQVGVVMDTK